VILTYSPYSVLGRNGDADHWVPKGYARAYADVIGTGNSGGCYDYGGNREKRTGHDVVEWISRQRWTTGRSGCSAVSYDGTTQYATAVTHPRGLCNDRAGGGDQPIGTTTPTRGHALHGH